MSFYEPGGVVRDGGRVGHHDSSHSKAIERLVQAALWEERPHLMGNASAIRFLAHHATAHPEFPEIHWEDWATMTSAVFLNQISFELQEDRQEVIRDLDRARTQHCRARSGRAAEVY